MTPLIQAYNMLQIVQENQTKFSQGSVEKIETFSFQEWEEEKLALASLWAKCSVKMLISLDGGGNVTTTSHHRPKMQPSPYAEQPTHESIVYTWRHGAAQSGGNMNTLALRSGLTPRE